MTDTDVQGTEVDASRGSCWFSARLIYATKVSLPEGRLSIQEDHWLLESASATEAFETASSGARAAARLGTSLATGQIDEIERDDLRAIFQRFFGSGSPAKTANKEGRGAPGGDWTMHEFLGFGDLVKIGGTLRHGTEIGRYQLALRQELAQLPPKERLMAFDPAAPTYTGGARVAENVELFRRHRWYLAEILLRLFDPAGVPLDEFTGRMILLNADGPDAAYRSAVEQANRQDMQGRFWGVRELSLITDSFKSSCVLRTDEYEVRPGDVSALVKPKQELSAFRDVGDRRT